MVAALNYTQNIRAIIIFMVAAINYFHIDHCTTFIAKYRSLLLPYVHVSAIGQILPFQKKLKCNQR
jgi:hypothetical protein